MKIRPLFILADLEAGGAQGVILTVIRRLSRQNFEPHLGIIKKNGPRAKEIPDNVHIHDLKVRRVRYALPNIIRLCRTLRPDTVVSTLGHLNLSLLAGRFFLPQHTRLIVREANTPSIRVQYTRYPMLYRFLYQRLYPLADRVICNSKYMQRDLVESFPLPAEKTIVIPNPVDRERIDQFLLHGHNPYQSGKYHLVSVGRLNYQKGFDLLLKAFDKSLKKVPDLHLTIVGEGSEAESLKRLADDLGIAGSITFAGHQGNPYPFMAYADLFVSSSRWEGSPNAVLESLACGTPVLAFDCPGGTGEIIRQGENGWLVPSEDFEAMAEKIVELMQSNRWQSLQTSSLLPEEYGCQNVVKKWEELLMKG